MKTITKITLTLLTCLFVFSSCCEKQNSDKPKQAISYDQAKNLQQEYIRTRVEPALKAALSSGIERKEDVRDVTFDLEAVKQYIAYVEKEAAKKGVKNGLGLRVYLGAYENSEVTMFFMPTKKKEPIKGANNFFYFEPDDEIIEDVDGLNLGHGGNPPQANNLK